MAVFVVRYHAYLEAPTDSLTVQCPVGDGETVERTLDVNDMIFGINPASPNRGDLWQATDEGIAWAPLPFDVNPGDTVVVNCSAVDLPGQAGLAVVIARDGTFVPLASRPPTAFVQHLVPTAGPQDINADVVTADTTTGDVVGVLPSGVAARTIRVVNGKGAGSFQVDPAEGETIAGQSTLVLGPDDRATLVALGDGDWSVW